jgi:hypothetical protein
MLTFLVRHRTPKYRNVHRFKGLNQDRRMADVDQVKFVLRLPPVLHNKVKRRAKTKNTSMNKEITNILNEAFSHSTTDKMLKELVARLESKKVI